MFAISYMYYSVLGTFITVFFGTIVSWLLATEDDVCEEKLLNPYLVAVMNYIRRRRTKDAVAPENGFGEQVNHGYECTQVSEKGNHAFSGNNKLNTLEMLSVTTDESANPNESYRKINE